MKLTTTDPDASPAAKLQAVVNADRSGSPFLVYAGPEGAQRLAILEAGDTSLWLGRDASCEIVLDWDEQVSRTHAELSRMGSGWAVTDDGLSRNGTFVGSERVGGRRRLRDRDVLRLGTTEIVFRELAAAPRPPRTAPAASPVAVDLTPMQHKVLVALCRPLLEAEARALPATNREIAAALVLSVEGVKTHLRALFAKLDVQDLPQNRKRSSLAERALAARLVTARDLRSPGA